MESFLISTLAGIRAVQYVRKMSMDYVSACVHNGRGVYGVRAVCVCNVRGVIGICAACS